MPSCPVAVHGKTRAWPLGLAFYSVPQNSFLLPTGSIFSFATLGFALGKDYAGGIVTLFCGTLYHFGRGSAADFGHAHRSFRPKGVPE